MLQLPVILDTDGVVLPAFETLTTLDGALYTLGWRWNARAGAWLFDLSDAEGTPIVSGVAVRVGVPFLFGVGPGGAFLALDSTGAGVDPGLTDLGDRVGVYYASAGEV